MKHPFQIPGDLHERPPLHHVPGGPVWVATGREVFGAGAPAEQVLLRRYPLEANYLMVSAVLQHSGGSDHPRLRGPLAWERDEAEQGGVWVALERPRGRPLAQVVLEGLAWSAALELWRPLAQAVARAHSRGIFCGLIHPWSVWVDEAGDRLCMPEAGCWILEPSPGETEAAGGGPGWWPPELARACHRRMPSPFSDIFGLGRLLVHLALGSGAALEPQPDLSGLPARVRPALQRACRPDPAERLPRVEELLASCAPQDLQRVGPPGTGEPTHEEVLDILGARVSERAAISHERYGRGTRFYLNLSHPDATGEDRVGAFFWEGVDDSLHDAVRWAWEGAEINLLDARLVEDSSGRRFVTSAQETLPVLEPTFTVTVSNVLKAVRCTSRVLVDERDGGASSRALVLGNLVHGLLDDLLQRPEQGFEAAFEARARSLRLAMLAAGLDDEDARVLREEARQHWEHMERYTQDCEHTHGPLHRVGWSGHHVEVTRYSPRYGLEGRIDLATEDSRDGLQIVELKSGSSWDGHLSQVRCYTLLWEGVASQRDLRIRGAILYSRAGRMVRAPMDDIHRERRLLRARNELVACHRSFVDPSFDYTPPHFMQVPRNCTSGSCRFRKDRCREQTEVLGLGSGATPATARQAGGPWSGHDEELVRRAWSYWRHFSSLIERERWAEQAEMGRIFRTSRLRDRIQGFSAVDDVTLESIDRATQRITFRALGAQIFSPGDKILAHRGDIHNAHILQGRCVEAGFDRVTLETQGAPIAALLERTGWILDAVPARIGYRTAHRALYRTIRARNAARLGVLLAPGQPQAQTAFAVEEPPRLSAATTEALNPTQRRAVELAVAAPAGALIQGPPGTGKTTVIAHIVRELVRRGQRVLLCAQTNTAIDALLRRLLSIGEASFLRIGHQERSPELAEAIAVRGLEPGEFFSEELAARTPTLGELAQRLDDAPVVAATAYAAVGASVFEHLARDRGAPMFDVALVDEAAQINEPMSLAPLHLARRFVLVGDHRQLPPIVRHEYSHSFFVEGVHHELEENGARQPASNGPEEAGTLEKFSLDPLLAPLRVAGLDRSLFERLVAHLPYTMLDEQYRMVREIMAFSNAAFYGGRLRAHASVADQRLALPPGYLQGLEPGLRAVIDPERPVVFADVAHGLGAGRTNQAEADALLETLGALLASGAFDARLPGAPTVGVITPFRAQVQLLRRMVHEQLGPDAPVDVDTVERYQGSERDVILVSMVKTERAGDFLADARRLNVTLTRARSKLILFGHRNCLMEHPLLRALIEQPETQVVPWEPQSARGEQGWAAAGG